MQLIRAKVLSRRVLFQTKRSAFKVPGKMTVSGNWNGCALVLSFGMPVEQFDEVEKHVGTSRGWFPQSGGFSGCSLCQNATS